MSATQISTLEAAKRLGVSIGWLYQLIRVGQIPATKTGRQWFIPTAAVEERTRTMHSHHLEHVASEKRR